MALAEADVSACEALLNRLRDEGRLPGMVAAVFTPAGPAWEGRSGSTSANRRSSGSPPTLWCDLIVAAPAPPPDSTTSG